MWFTLIKYVILILGGLYVKDNVLIIFIRRKRGECRDNVYSTNMKKVFIGIITSLYIIIAIITTVLLLNFDGQNGAKVGNKYFINVRDKAGDYNVNDLLIANVDNNVFENEEILYFKIVDAEKTVAVGTVKEVKQVNENEEFIYVSDREFVKAKDVIGKTNEVVVWDSFGGLVSFLESRVGFLIVILLPIFLLFAYEIYVIKKEINNLKNSKKRKK